MTSVGRGESVARIGVDDLRTLLAVAETGSFRRAGSRLSLGQSSVSRRIQRLEDMLGVSVFERSSTGTRLTRAGKRFAANARHVVSDLGRAVDEARAAGAGQNGRLSIGLMASLSQGVIRDVVSAFCKANSEIELIICEAERSDLLTRLSHREIDVVIAAGNPEKELGDGLLLHQEAIFLALPANHALSERDAVDWSEVDKEVFIISAREPGPKINDHITRSATDLAGGIRFQSFEIGREGIMNLVGLGFGISLIADHWRGVTYPGVTFTRIGGPTECIPFSLTWRPENDNPALCRFLSLARIEAKRNGVLS